MAAGNLSSEQTARGPCLLQVTDGMLLVGHGTRDAAGIAEFFQVAREIARCWEPRPVEPCFLEMATPTIAEGIAKLAERGARRVVVMPLLLFAAGHAKRDIPAAVAAAADRYPGMTVRHAEPLDCHEQIVFLSARRFAEALADRPAVAGEATLLLMVGRGSRDAEATAAMRRFAQIRAGQTAVARAEVCFLAMQPPSLNDALRAAATAGFRRIVVQPHLLFSGEMLAEIDRAVARLADARPGAVGGPEWIVTAALGPEPELVAAIMNRATATP